MDATGEITSLLTKAMELAIRAEGSYTGNYAIIAQATVNPDATFVITWQRYYGPPMVQNDDGTANA